MLDSAATLGSMEATPAQVSRFLYLPSESDFLVGQRKKYASQSLEYNSKDATFKKLFPELVELHLENQKKRAEEAAANPGPAAGDGSVGGSKTCADGKGDKAGAEIANIDPTFLLIVAAVAVAILAFFLQL